MGLRISASAAVSLALAALIYLLTGTSGLSGQAGGYNYYYRICFSDKGPVTPDDFSAGDLLSSRAISRREKTGIKVPDHDDLPVYRPYLNQVSARGLDLHSTSKWLNTGLFRSASPADTEELMSLTFVDSVILVKRPGKKSTGQGKLDFATETNVTRAFNNPLVMISGDAIHNSGYTGKGILIAVLDGGFSRADIIPSLSGLRSRQGIKATFDFVRGDSYVYGFHDHGTAVLSVLAGSLPGLIAGTAPGADYCLLRTEDGGSEFPVEEDYWAAGAEYADSIGADIISSSLGYYTFDDPSMNYSFADMDGNSTFVTKAADIAASKGIVVIASAGNERNKPWKRIIAPSDGDNVVAAGAVDGFNTISSFSSAGPSSDGRIKPDLVAQGVSVPVQTTETAVVLASGTSFSCPVLSGITACIMQAAPEALSTEIINALKENSDRYNMPDSLYGYGLPYMTGVLASLQRKYVKETGKKILAAPNPFTGIFRIIFDQPPEKLQLEILDYTGKLIFRKDYDQYMSRSFTVSEMVNSAQGIYFIRVRTSGGTYTGKIIKADPGNE